MRRIVFSIRIFIFTFIAETMYAQGPPDPGGSPVYEEPPLGGSAALADDSRLFLLLIIAFMLFKIWQLKPQFNIKFLTVRPTDMLK